MSFQFDSVRLKQRITDSLEKIYTQADPKLLNQYRSLIKKEVSFFRRSYFAAFLLMELDQGGNQKSFGGGTGTYRNNPSRKYQKSGQEGDDSRSDRKPLPEEESARLFVSIGRSRRVFPREILGLIAAKTSVSKDDIGAIRILDNYSFVQVRTTVADDIIEALNGKPFRGRPLLVNYARNRKDEAVEAKPSQPDAEAPFEYAVKPEAEAAMEPTARQASPIEVSSDYAEPAAGVPPLSDDDDPSDREEEAESAADDSAQEEDDHPDKENI
jgi:hypothetical protein